MVVVVVVVLVEVERVGRRGGVGRARVQLGGDKRGGDVGHEWCGVWRLSCGSVYTLSPLRTSIPISLTPTPPRQHVEVFAYTDRDLNICAMYEQVVDDERWRGTIDGLATVLFACRGVHEHGHGR